MKMNQKTTCAGQIAYFMRRLYEKGLTTTLGGNISMRCGDKVYITPSGTDKGEITEDDIGVTDLDGNITGRQFKPSIESRMHIMTYLARPDISAIVHAHPLTGCAFAASDATLRTDMLSESYAILGKIAVADYHLMGSPELAVTVSEAARSADCIIMRNHGIMTLGRTMLEAFDKMEVFETTAKINLVLFGLDGHPVPLSAGELKKIDVLIGRKTAAAKVPKKKCGCCSHN